MFEIWCICISCFSEQKMPEGSWKCEKCSNINYPFRTKCNRQNCGADKPAESKKSPSPTTSENDQVRGLMHFLCHLICYLKLFLLTTFVQIKNSISFTCFKLFLVKELFLSLSLLNYYYISCILVNRCLNVTLLLLVSFCLSFHWFAIVYCSSEY